MSQASVITRTASGHYEVTTKANDDRLSAVVYTPRFASTLWGARRLARKHQKRKANDASAMQFREVIK